MQNLKIRTSIALSLLLPIVGLIAFAGTLVWDKQQTATEMEGLNDLALLAPVISGMIHELQVERGTAAIFIGSKGKEFAKELPDQFLVTNTKSEALIAALHGYDASVFNTAKAADAAATPQEETKTAQGEQGESAPDNLLKLDSGVSNSLVEKMNVAIGALTEIEAIREKTLKKRATVLNMSKYYTDTISSLLSIIEEMTVLSSNAKVTTAIAAYTNFLQSKERAARERDLGGAAFGIGKFTFLVHKNFTELIAQQEELLRTFSVNATDEQYEFLTQTLASDIVKEVERLRVIAIASSQPEFNLQGVTSKQWTDAATGRIGLLKTVEDKLSEDLVSSVSLIQSAAETAFSSILIISLTLLAITLVFVMFIVRGITRPVALMTGAMSQLANGDLGIEVPALGRKNEVGEMAAAVQMFKNNAIRTKEIEAEAERQKHKTEEEKRQMMLKMADDFEASIGGVVNSVSSASTEMQCSAEAVTETATLTSEQSAAASAAAEEASTNVQTVASAAEELSSSISEISRQVAQSTQIAGAAVAEVDGANTKVQGLATAAQKIGEVVALITDIADQTNLLALNATIEAARAGDAGKGFAVVASEVKNLANQTARATEEISAQIGGIQTATQDAVQAIGSIGGTIGKMNEIASAIAAAVEEQGAATQEIARNVEQAATGTHEVTANISNVNQGAAETGQSANQMLSAASELSQQSEILRGEVDKFLATIRNG